MHTTFILYIEADEVLAKRIYADLLAAGVRPWAAVYDIAPGDDGNRAITQALAACQQVVILLTKKLLRNAEAAASIQRVSDKHIIPVIADMGVKVPEGLPEPINLKRRYAGAVQEIIVQLPADSEPLSKVPAWQRGNEAYFMGDYEEALKAYQEITEHTPITLNSLAAAHNAWREHERALELLNQAIEQDPNQAAFYRNRSLAYSALKQHEEALADDEKAVGLEPELPYGWSSRAMTLIALERYDEARESIGKAIELAPENSLYHYQLGFINNRAGDPQAALAAFDRALKLTPDDLDATIGRRIALGRLGRYQEALSEVDKDIKKYPRRASSYVQRSLINFYLERYEEAVSDATHALQHGQDNQMAAFYNRAIAQWRLGNEEDAHNDMLLAIGLFPDLKTEAGIINNAESAATRDTGLEILKALEESGKLAEQEQ